ncbi:MAG: hypothetical protein ACU0BF_13110 [Paracoccaceae bacterium]
MIWQDVAADWPAFIPRVLTHWPDLDEDEVQAVGGDYDRFVALLAARPDHDEETARDAIREWLEGQQPADAVMDPTRDNDRIRASARHIPPGEDVYSEDGDFGDDRTPEPRVGRVA